MTDNELIAEFMGLTYNRRLIQWVDKDGYGEGAYLYYDTSWDWLMPVVEKITNMGYDVLINATGLRNENHSCDITTTTDIHAATSGQSLINVVYEAIVEFIKWYNQQKQ